MSAHPVTLANVAMRTSRGAIARRTRHTMTPAGPDGVDDAARATTTTTTTTTRDKLHDRARAARDAQAREDDARERRLRMIEMSVEKCHQRTHALAKLIKCAREEDQEMISGALDVVERVRARVEDAGGDAREETRGGGGASTTTTFDHAAFERRMDARVDRLLELVVNAVQRNATLVSAETMTTTRGEVDALREALRAEREARARDVERLTADVERLKRERADGACVEKERVTASVSAPDATRRDEDDASDEECEAAAATTTSGRPELDARRRRLQALYRELQTLSF